MREEIDLVSCALCMFCLGKAANCNCQDCNRQRMQRVQNNWSTGTEVCQNTRTGI